MCRWATCSDSPTSFSPSRFRFRLLPESSSPCRAYCFRVWASGHLEKNVRLATTGPYAYSRNPLYLGTLLIGVGFAIAGETLLLGAAFLIVMLFIYWPVMRQEEAALISRFGGNYRAYASAVPLFWPRVRPSRTVGERFAWSRYLMNREYQAALGYTGAVLFLCLKLWVR